MQGIYSLHGATSSTGFSEPSHQSQPQPGKMVPHHCLFVLKRHQIRWECLLSACRCRRPPRPRGSQGLTTAVMAPIWWPASRLPTLLFMTLNKVTPQVMPFVTSTHGQLWPICSFLVDWPDRDRRHHCEDWNKQATSHKMQRGAVQGGRPTHSKDPLATIPWHTSPCQPSLQRALIPCRPPRQPSQFCLSNQQCTFLSAPCSLLGVLCTFLVTLCTLIGALCTTFSSPSPSTSPHQECTSLSALLLHHPSARCTRCWSRPPQLKWATQQMGRE